MKVLGIHRSRQAAAAARTELGKAGLALDAFDGYRDGTRTFLNTVGKDLSQSQWFDDEAHMSTAAALAGVALERMYPSVVFVHYRQQGRQFACGWIAACRE